jgi:hypothetical protein
MHFREDDIESFWLSSVSLAYPFVAVQCQHTGVLIHSTVYSRQQVLQVVFLENTSHKRQVYSAQGKDYSKSQPVTNICLV